MTTLHDLKKRGYHEHDLWVPEANALAYYPREIHKTNPQAQGLEIGCGPRKVFSKATGIDISPTSKADIIGPGDDLPYDDESMDYVISSHVIEHFVNPLKTLREWKRVIKPTGILAYACPNCWGSYDTFEVNPDHKYITTPTIMSELMTMVGGFTKIAEGGTITPHSFFQIWEKRLNDELEPELHGLWENFIERK